MVCLTVTTDIHGADNSRSKRVLIVSTGSNFAPGFTHAAETVADTLRQLESGPLELYSESLDIVRFPSGSYSRLFRNYLGEKYIDYPLDLILLIYVGNLGLAEKLLKELFPGVPIVVIGLTEEEISPGQLGTHLTGLAQRSDPRGTIELVLRLQPETRRIVVIGGTAEVDTAGDQSRARGGTLVDPSNRIRLLDEPSDERDDPGRQIAAATNGDFVYQNVSGRSRPSFQFRAGCEVDRRIG